MRRVAGKPTFVVDEDDAGRPIGAPFPHHKVEIIGAGPCGEASNPHAGIARRDQAVSHSLRRRDRAGKHFRFPSGACKVRFADDHHAALLFVQRIEDGRGINLICAERERLHGPAQRLRFANGGQRGKGRVECRYAPSIEAPTVTARALAG